MNSLNISAIILAGGFSSRMGKNKAELVINNESFLEHQINKLKNLGIEDIIISGYDYKTESYKCVHDVYPHRGPMSGIHAGLGIAENEDVLVIAVDSPLIPEELLADLIDFHKSEQSDITLVKHNGINEPLIAVYKKSLFSECEELLKGEKTSMRELMKKSKVSFMEYSGDEKLLMNFNTPEEYKLIEKLI